MAKFNLCRTKLAYLGEHEIFLEGNIDIFHFARYGPLFFTSHDESGVFVVEYERYGIRKPQKFLDFDINEMGSTSMQFLYFTKRDESGLFRISYKGGDIEKVFDEECENLEGYGEFLSFVDMEKHNIYSHQMEDLVHICDDFVSKIQYGYYYISMNDDAKLCKLDSWGKTNTKTVLTSEAIYDYAYDSSNLYYIAEDDGLLVVLKDNQTTRFDVKPLEICCVSFEKKNRFFDLLLFTLINEKGIFALEGNNITKVTDKIASSLVQGPDEYLYYLSYE